MLYSEVDNMNILALVNQCSDPGLAHILGIIKSVLGLIQMIGPIVALVSIIINLIKLMSSPDEKKYKNLIKNWLVAFIMLFILPVIINVVMSLFDDSFTISSCWNYAVVIFSTR